MKLYAVRGYSKLEVLSGEFDETKRLYRAFDRVAEEVIEYRRQIAKDNVGHGGLVQRSRDAAIAAYVALQQRRILNFEAKISQAKRRVQSARELYE